MIGTDGERERQSGKSVATQLDDDDDDDMSLEKKYYLIGRIKIQIFKKRKKNNEKVKLKYNA